MRTAVPGSVPGDATLSWVEAVAQIAERGESAVVRVRSGARSTELRLERGRILARDGMRTATGDLALCLTWQAPTLERVGGNVVRTASPTVAVPAALAIEDAKTLVGDARRAMASRNVPFEPLRAVLPAPAGLKASDALVLARFATPRMALEIVLEGAPVIGPTTDAILRLLAMRLLVPAATTSIAASVRSDASARATMPSRAEPGAGRRVPVRASASTKSGARGLPWWDADVGADLDGVETGPDAFARTAARVERDRASADPAWSDALALVASLAREPVARPRSLDAALALAGRAGDPDAPLSLVAGVLAEHRALALAVIGEASAAAHGRTIDSLERAVLRIGLERTRQLAWEGLLDELSGRARNTAVRAERRASLITAALVVGLAPPAIRQHALLAGALAGLGRILLESRGGVVPEAARRRAAPRYHAALASAHALAWGLPVPVAAAVGAHVEAPSERTPELVRIVRAARIAATMATMPEQVRATRESAATAIHAALPTVAAVDVLVAARGMAGFP